MKKNNKNIINPCSGYFLLWTIYLMQGTLYPTGSVLSQILILAILLISLCHAYLLLNKRHIPIFFNGLNLLVLMYTVYGIVLFFTDGWYVQIPGKSGVQTFNYLKSYYMSLLPIYSCFYYTKRGYLKLQTLQLWAIIFIGVAISQYFSNQREMLAKLIEEGSRREDITNNIGYVMASLIPIALVFNKRIIFQYVYIGICAAFVFMAMKRGAILISMIGIWMFVWHSLRKSIGYKKFISLFIIGIAFAYLYDLVIHLIEDSDYFNARIERTLAGDTSGRDELFSGLINYYINESSIFNLLIGYGARGTDKIIGNGAHNDWIETLVCHGILGTILFFFFLFAFFLSSYNKKYSIESLFILHIIFVMYIVKTFFSMSIGDMTIYVDTMLGFALADGFSSKRELILKSIRKKRKNKNIVS